MTRTGWTEPWPFAGIRNFGWAVPSLLARGEQPPLEAATFESLRDAGIHTVISLRPDGELPPAVARRLWPVYHARDEQALVEAAGLRFRHVPLEDFAAPSPAEVARALTAIDEAVAEAPGVYVHCRAGAGRASVVSGAWMVANGAEGDAAAAMYERCMHHITATIGFTPEQEHEMRVRVGQPYVWWALRESVAALGSPVTREIDLLPPERAPGADNWSFTNALLPWRVRRASALTGTLAAD